MRSLEAVGEGVAGAAGATVTMAVAVVTARDMEGARVVTAEEGGKEVEAVALTGATVGAGAAGAAVAAVVVVVEEEEAMLARFSWAISPGVPRMSIFTLPSRLVLSRMREVFFLGGLVVLYHACVCMLYRSPRGPSCEGTRRSELLVMSVINEGFFLISTSRVFPRSPHIL